MAAPAHTRVADQRGIGLPHRLQDPIAVEKDIHEHGFAGWRHAVGDGGLRGGASHCRAAVLDRHEP